MATSLRDDTTAVEQPRHVIEQTVLDGQGKAYVGAPDVPESGEPTVEARMEKLCREMRQIRHWGLHNPHNVQSRRIHVYMGIDEPRHQNTAAAVDDHVAVGGRAL